MVSQRLAGVPMENNGILAVPRPTAGSPVGLAPGAARRSTAATPPMLGLDRSKLRVVCPWVGGGFGPKAAGYVEYIVAGRPRSTLGRPVKWIETRSEDMVSLVHGRDFVMTAKLGVNERRQDRRPRRQRRRCRPAPTRRSARSCRCSPR